MWRANEACPNLYIGGRLRWEEECRERNTEKGGENALLEDHAGMMVRSDLLFKPSLIKILSHILPERRYWQCSQGIDNGEHRLLVRSFGNEYFMDARS